MASRETVSKCVSRWLGHLEAIKFRAVESYRSQAVAFAEATGHLALSALRPHHVTGWIDGQAAWKTSTRYSAWTRLRTMFRWNLTEGHTRTDPLAGYRRPARYRPAARGAEYVLPDDLVDLLIRVSRGRWRDFLTALSTTGARPGELANAIASNYHAADGVIIHRGDEEVGYIHKTARTKRHGPRDRVIYLDEATRAIVERNVARGELLFPAGEEDWWDAGRIARKWKLMLAEPRVIAWMATNQHSADHVIPYSFRHTWITRAITRGVSPKLVADLCGTSVAMIERHYSHAASNRVAMREAFKAAL